MPNGQYCSTNDFDLRNQSLTFPTPAGTTQLEQLVICGAGLCNPGATMHTLSSVVTINDPRPPAISLSGPLVQRRWVAGSQLLEVHASDSVGLSRYSFRLGPESDGTSFPCNYALPKPCPDVLPRTSVGTEHASQGPNQLVVSVVDGAGNASNAVQTVYVDNQPPARVKPTLDGGEAWRPANGFRLRWVTPSQPFAPVVRARYRICSITACVDRAVDAPNIDEIGPLLVSQPGDYTVRVWLEDEAGNQSFDLTASDPVHLRYDPEAPGLTFQEPDPSDPLRVSVLVQDRYSGPASGEIEMRQRGGDTWHALQTTLSGNTLTAYVDDERFRSGAYEFRARAIDHAGNEGSTDRRAGGARATLDLPVRVVTRLAIGVPRSTGKHRGRKEGRRRTKLVKHARVRHGRRIKVQGRLTNADGQPLDSATVEVYSDTINDLAGPVTSGIVHTDQAGRFSYVALANRSKLLRFRYAGSRRIRPVQEDFRLSVPAISTIRARPRRLLNGETVTLKGKVLTRPLPPSGKLIEVQAFFRNRWRTFSTTRAGTNGRWRFDYQFGGTRGRIHYRLRARLPAEGGYPFDTGYSPVARVVVTGL
jgi:hypothetical protein